MQTTLNNTTAEKLIELELDKYIKMLFNDKYKTANALPLWKFHQDKLPYLAKLARQLYSIPATSTGVEWQFSSAGIFVII